MKTYLARNLSIDICVKIYNNALRSYNLNAFRLKHVIRAISQIQKVIQNLQNSYFLLSQSPPDSLLLPTIATMCTTDNRVSKYA